MKRRADDLSFEFLELSTCEKRAKVDRRKKDSYVPMKMDEFVKSLSINQVKHVRIVNGTASLLPTIRQHCMHLRRIDLLDGEGSLKLQEFHGLAELNVPNVRMPTHAFRTCLENNPDLESLEYDCYWYHAEFNDLLRLLPNLKRLQLYVAHMDDEPVVDDELVNSIVLSKVLTKLSIRSVDCDELVEPKNKFNDMLGKLLKKTNLKELCVNMHLNAKTFTTISLFKNLEVLSITHANKAEEIYPDSITLPSKLKRFKINHFKLSRKNVLLIVKQLQLLEELHIGTTSAQKCPWLYKDEIPLIAKEMDRSRQTRGILKIFYSDVKIVNGKTYKSGYLEIINSHSAKQDKEPQRIFIECDA